MHPDPVPTVSVTQWIHLFRSGETGFSEEAARRIWQRYLPRLLTLARRHLDRRIRTRHDEEDAAQSMALESFLRPQPGATLPVRQHEGAP
jgi:hypothetical protein